MELLGYTHWGSRYDDEYVVGPFSGLFASSEPPSYWRSMQTQMASKTVPAWACKRFPAWAKKWFGNSCTFGSIYKGIAENALKDWTKKTDAERKAEADKTAGIVRNLQRMERALNEEREIFKAVHATYGRTFPDGRADRSRWPKWEQEKQKTFNGLNVTYQMMAASVYGNSYEIDKKSGKPVLPGPAVDATSGLGFGRYEFDPDLHGTEFDGMAMGAVIGQRIEQEQFGIEPVTVVLIIAGLIAVTAIGVSMAQAWGKSSEAGKAKAESDLAEARIAHQKDIAADPNIDAATKAKLLENIDKQAADFEVSKRTAEKEKKDTAAEIVKVAMPYIIGVGAVGLLYKWVEARFMPSRPF